MRHKKDAARLMLDNAGSSRGAQLGRPDFYPVCWRRSPKLHLRRLRMYGDYDSPGGAYWGLPQDLWVAFSRDRHVCRPSGCVLRAIESHQIQLFTRAKSREEAKREIKARYQEARFYR